MLTPQHILIADGDSQQQEKIADTLQEAGYVIKQVTDGNSALTCLRESAIDAVFTNLDLPGLSGLDVLRFAVAQTPPIPVIVSTVYASVESAVEVMRLGAVDYLSIPAETNDLLAAVEKALERRAMLTGPKADQPEEITSFGGLIGDTPAMHDVFDQIRRCAPFRATVLITGESGTGKELVARALHALSPYAKGPFIAVNCSAMPSELVESTLFGYEKGAFTGAERMRQGVFEAANNGTLFLDEIGDLPYEAQAKLLRTIENREIIRLGSNTPIQVNVRLLAATHRDLKKAAENHQFREDLYYRLNVLHLPLPPLRDRREDIPLLMRVFLDRFAHENELPPKNVAQETLVHMTAYDWPGNVRELKNITERLIITSRGDEILPSDLPSEFQPRIQAEQVVEETTLNTFADMSLETIERVMIQQTLERTESRPRTAEILGISLRTLQRKLREYEAER